MSAVLNPISTFLGLVASDRNLAPAFRRAFPKRATVLIAKGYPHPDDDGVIAHWETVTMTRREAADALRRARQFGARGSNGETSGCMSVSRSWSSGYDIAGWFE